jgi:signal transduction histidine kinase
MLRIGNIRSRIVLSTLVVVVLAIASMGSLAVWLLRDSVAESVRRDVKRTVALVEQTGFLSSPNILEEVSRFLKAEVVSLSPRGVVLTSSLDPARRETFDKVLQALWLKDPRGTRLYELEIAGQQWTIGLTVLERSGSGSAEESPAAGVALIYSGHRLTMRQRSAQIPLIVLTIVMLGLAMGAGFFVARTVVKPIEQLARSAARIGDGDFEARLDLRTGDEIETLSRALTVMIENLREAQVSLDRSEKLAALGRFAGALAHEVRTPLTAISMLLSLEQESMAEGRTKDALTMALGEIEKLSLLSTKLLTFVRGPSVDLVAASLEPVIDEILLLLRQQFEHHKVEVKKELLEELPLVPLDAQAFRHVILNLLQNAAESMADGGLLRISARLLGERVQLEIADQGCGISEEAADSVFEAFYTKKNGGTGLGLAITKAIVESHNGSIGHHPGAEGGTVFVVELPTKLEDERG